MPAEQGRRNLSALVDGRVCPHIGAGGYRFREKKMFGPVKRVARALRGRSVEERELAYLNDSVDRVDLEYRQRQIDRGLFRKGF